MKFNIYQIYYDEVSREKSDPGFIPFNNAGLDCHNFENDVIKHIYLYRRQEWINKDYVGVFSWRFFEKTGLNARDVYKKVSDSGYPVVSFMPPAYKKHLHPFSREGFDSVLECCKQADKAKLFDFKMLNYPVKKIVWCNYWVASPEVFELYCHKYLLKCIDFFRDKKELKELYDATEKHRGTRYISFTFFLEGLFGAFLQEEKIDHLQL